MRKVLAVIGVVLLLAILVALYRAASWSSAAHTSLGAEIASTRAAGIPVTPAEMDVTEPPFDRNAAPYWESLTGLLAQRRLMPADRAVLSPSTYGYGAQRRAAVPTVAQLRASLSRRIDVVTLVHQALDRPQCVFHYKYALAAQYPEYETMRVGSRVAAAEARVLLADGRPDDAVRRLADGLRIGRQIDEEEPIVVALLTARSCDGVVLDGLADVLRQAGDRPGVARQVRDAIAAGWRPLRASRAMSGELVQHLQTMDFIRRQGGVVWASGSSSQGSGGQFGGLTLGTSKWKPPFWDGFVDYNEVFIVSAMRKQIVALNRPYPDAVAAARAVQLPSSRSSSWRLAIAEILFPVYSGIAARSAEDTAHAGVVAAAAEVLDWRLKRGALPDRLEQAMPRVAADPFDLKPLRYRREGAGFVVWSVGETGHFTPGVPSAKARAHEVMFRYPAGRGQSTDP